MTGPELVALVPLALPALGGAAVLLAGALGAGRRASHPLALGTLAMAIVSVMALAGRPPAQVTPLVAVDAFGLVFMGLLFGVTGLVTVLSQPYLAARRLEPEAFHALLLFAAAGMAALACASHFASLLLGVETLSVALYAMIGYLKGTRPSLEAAVKYLVLAALSSGYLLLGIALTYAVAGTMELGPALAAAAAAVRGPLPEASWAALGLLLVVAAFGFKLAAVPFHMWSPDVYQGAPAPVTMLVATGSKGAVLAVLVRALAPMDLSPAGLAPPLTVLALLTMFAGNLLALLQQDLKRLLAYSAVAHVGYVLVAVVAGGAAGAEAVVFYVLSYAIMTAGAFGVVTLLSSGGAADIDGLEAYRGLGRRRPYLAAALALMILSLAGVPPTAGFVAKLAVLEAALGAGLGWLALATAVASGVAVFYYLRVVFALYMEDGPIPEPGAGPAAVPGLARPRPIPMAAGGAMALMALVVLAMGLLPGPWLRVARVAVAAVVGP